MNIATLPPFAAELKAWLEQRFPAAAQAALQAAALVASRAEEGHVCLHLSEMAGQHWQGTALPELPAWRMALLQSGFVAQAEGYAPLVLDGDRLYLGRLWADELTVAAELAQRASATELTPKQARTVLDPLFAGTAGDDGQRLAAATALLNRIAVISGGPGTGKTTTVAKVLAALVQLEPAARIVLAAPTGRAAARMVEALKQARDRLPIDMITRAALPEEALTLHRLLGFRPDGAQPRYGPGQPLGLDILVVDEASMIDLALFARLLAALPRHARLILLGDRDQLASVEAGSAFAELVRQAGRTPEGSRRLAAATGARLPPGKPTSALADGIALLNVSHRFGSDSGIGALARCANAGDSQGALQLLRDPPPDLAWQPGLCRDWQGLLLAQLQTRLGDYREAVAARDIDAAYHHFHRLRLLCALREGPVGLEAINRLLETRLLQQDPRRQPWYAGRPVIVRVNDSVLGLANGDVGLVLEGEQGLRVYFPQEASWRGYAPTRLPRHETAFALTVHQSQGSEFDEVWLLLPDEDAAVLSRSLIYTALTRARHKVAVWGSASTLAGALQRSVQRDSGLADRLRAPADATPS